MLRGYMLKGREYGQFLTIIEKKTEFWELNRIKNWRGEVVISLFSFRGWVIKHIHPLVRKKRENNSGAKQKQFVEIMLNCNYEILLSFKYAKSKINSIEKLKAECLKVHKVFLAYKSKLHKTSKSWTKTSKIWNSRCSILCFKNTSRKKQALNAVIIKVTLPYIVIFTKSVLRKFFFEKTRKLKICTGCAIEAHK